jgi:hypothetical protein
MSYAWFSHVYAYVQYVDVRPAGKPKTHTNTATRQLQEATPSKNTSHQWVGEWHAWIDDKPSKTHPAACSKEPHTSC